MDVEFTYLDVKVVFEIAEFLKHWIADAIPVAAVWLPVYVVAITHGQLLLRLRLADNDGDNLNLHPRPTPLTLTRIYVTVLRGLLLRN